MKQILIGIGLGAGAGILDIIPMLVQKLPWTADLSAFSMWVTVGFFLSISTLRLTGVVHGLLIAFLCLAPTAIIIGAQQPASLIPISVMTAVLGSLLGWAIDTLRK